MPTIKELLEAKDAIAVTEREKGKVDYDDLMVILHNERVRKNRKDRNKQEFRKDYLSKADRELMIRLSAVYSCLEEVINYLEKTKHPRSWLPMLKTAKTNTFKVMVEMFSQIPQEQQQRYFKELAYYNVFIGEYEPRRKEA